MLKLSTAHGQLMGERFARLIAWGLDEPQAFALAPHCHNITKASTDSEVESAICLAMVAAKEAMSPVPKLELVGGQRRDTLRSMFKLRD